jgi:hypothetical protein
MSFRFFLAGEISVFLNRIWVFDSELRNSVLYPNLHCAAFFFFDFALIFASGTEMGQYVYLPVPYKGDHQFF